jgi:glycosyltransferase involved in cell wall biosynthesis
MKISIIIPVFNEEFTILKVLKKIKEVQKNISQDFEIIVINDGSTDNTIKILKENEIFYDKLIDVSINRGKGNAINEGFKNSSGDIILIQDADLEYNPEEYQKLLMPFQKFNADVVFGSRFKSSEINRVLFFWHSLANKMITLVSNVFSDLNLTDVETGYKVFKKDIIKEINIEEKRFGFEIEITHKIANLKPKPKIFEVGISYNGRTYAEGKKIGIKDAVRAMYCIIKFGFIKRFI